MFSQEVKSDIAYEIKVVLFVMLMFLNAFAELIIGVWQLALLAKWQWFGGPTVLSTVIFCTLLTVRASRTKHKAEFYLLMAVMLVVGAVNSKIIG